MVEIVSKDFCCGCGACISACTRKAIIMKQDEFGFRYASVNTNVCVDCGKCKKVCPVIHVAKSDSNDKQIAFAASSRDESSIKSSSGGLFALFAKDVLNRKGVVFGTFLNSEFEALVIEIETIEDLPKLQGSKYVQSDMGDIYIRIKSYLQQERQVLFCGTPCQVAAVRNSVGENENLYLIDIVCHGVPSNEMFKQYIAVEEKKKKQAIVDFKFRNKIYGQDTVGNIVYKQKTKTMRAYQSSFYSYFLSCDIFRESCYNCHFASTERPGDVSLCDYWGAEQEDSAFVEECRREGLVGISGVFINSSKGLRMFDRIKENLLYRQTLASNIVKNNSNLSQPSKKGAERSRILQLYKDGGWDAVDRYYHKKNAMINFAKKVYHMSPKCFKTIILKRRKQS